MAANRLFLPQDTLDRWIEKQRITLAGEEMVLHPNGERFRLVTGVRFVAEVSGEPDTYDLVGKCKSADELSALGGEHYADSVILGDNAYQVVEGFLGVVLCAAAQDAPRPQATTPPPTPAEIAAGHSLMSAARAATGDAPSSDDVDPLTRLLLDK
ncbi:MAG: hypothetical protein OEZ06_29660 [Myxococcales bacterium]|nr:hypothetical protein [Myxococcales bacterium]